MRIVREGFSDVLYALGREGPAKVGLEGERKDISARENTL